ncbi:MAG TPA: spermidine synthase, partial [Nitrospina sp.]|nr:spermidine synthase [Nitrospina sp.]
DNFWLFINGSTQFSTYDEERYHEPLVHPLMGLIEERNDILILGGGDGLAAREILKYPDVVSLTLVDLDPAMTRLAQQDEIFL